MSLLLDACGEQSAEYEYATNRLRVWAHAGQAPERQVLEQQVARFNNSQAGVEVQLTLIPERSYNAQVQAAAIAGELPDLLEFDGPYLFNYVWQGHLAELDGLLSAETQGDLLPSIERQGSYRGRFYGVGVFDSGLGLYARYSALEAAGVRIPTGPDDAWSEQEFTMALTELANHDPDGMVLDLKLNYSGEWVTYAFSPLLQSAGGDLIDRSDYQSAKNILNSPQSVAAMKSLQRWISQGYVDPNVDDDAFVGGRVALSWGGHWNYSRYTAELGEDLVLLPLPDFGEGSRTGQGSWVWGISKTSKNKQAAGRFLEFLLQSEEVIAMVSANGAVPATRSAIERSPLYGAEGPLTLYTTQLVEGVAVPRPKTPAYPVITSAFQRAFADIRNNGDVQAALDKAVAAIDQDILDNKGYEQLGP